MQSACDAPSNLDFVVDAQLFRGTARSLIPEGQRIIARRGWRNPG
jgi:hypothetical protein